MILKNEIIAAEVTGFAPYGVFVKAGDYVGLIHISEISNTYIKDIYEFASVGDIVNVMVLDVDLEHKQLKLSYKKCLTNRKIKVKSLEIGFKAISDKLDNQIKKALKEMEDKT